MRLTFSALLAALPAVVSAQAPLSIGKPVRATLARGDTARYQVEADSGFIVRLSVDQVSANAGIRVLGPKGNQLRRVNAASRGMERVQFEVVEKGVHQVQVILADSTAGEYVITLAAREALSKDPAKLVDQLLAPWDRRDGPG